jgi:hypothetical protein
MIKGLPYKDFPKLWFWKWLIKKEKAGVPAYTEARLFPNEKIDGIIACCLMSNF